MKIIAYVQARMSSTRRPGKVMADLLGKAMILRQLERVSRSKLITDIVVLTSTDPSDDVLETLLKENGIKVFRGSLNNVLERYQMALEKFPSDIALRITADCPLIDPLVIDAVIESHISTNADYTSNSLDRRYPRGLDCEVFQPRVLQELQKFELDKDEKEHVTMGIYRRPEVFKLNSFSNPEDESSRRWTVDTPEDLEFVRHIYSVLAPKNPEFSSDDIRNYLKENPEKEHFETGVH